VSPRRGEGGGGNGLAFLNDRAAFVRRFVLAEVLAAPRGKTVRLARGRRAEPAPTAASAAPAAPAKPR
jgi:hypothetical protein